VNKHDDTLETGELYSPSVNTVPIEDDEDLDDTESVPADAPDTEGSESVAGGGGESLERYLREVANWDLLSADGERALARRTVKGDPEALEEMVNRNLRLVVYWAKRYRGSGLPIQDLIQEGNLGLMRAASKFDPRRGTRFSTYASWWIRQALARAICDRQDLIRIPVYMHQKMRTIDRLLESSGIMQSPDPDIEATVERLGIIPFKDWESTRRLQQSVSLDRHPDQERDGTIEMEDEKAVNPMREVYLRETREHVWRLLKELPPRHQAVLTLRYGLDGGDEHTLESIGARLNISRERVRQIQTEAIETIAERTGLPKPAAPLTRFRGGLNALSKVGINRVDQLQSRDVPATRRRPSRVVRRAVGSSSAR
jgi:RNA polymerase primary sigma factor